MEVDALFDLAIVELEMHNKCVRMTDKSPAGWNMVREYLEHDLPEDEADDR